MPPTLELTMDESQPPEESAEGKRKHAGHLEFPRTAERYATHDLERDVRCGESDQRLHHLRPPDEREHDGWSVPDVVETDDDNAEGKNEESFLERARGSLRGEALKPDDPGFRLEEMREPDHQQRNRRKDLGGVLHAHTLTR